MTLTRKLEAKRGFSASTTASEAGNASLVPFDDACTGQCSNHAFGNFARQMPLGFMPVTSMRAISRMLRPGRPSKPQGHSTLQGGAQNAPQQKEVFVEWWHRWHGIDNTRLAEGILSISPALLPASPNGLKSHQLGIG